MDIDIKYKVTEGGVVAVVNNGEVVISLMSSRTFEDDAVVTINGETWLIARPKPEDEDPPINVGMILEQVLWHYEHNKLSFEELSEMFTFTNLQCDQKMSGGNVKKVKDLPKPEIKKGREYYPPFSFS